MYRFKRILATVSLEGSCDDELISYVSHVAALAKSEHVKFLHVAEEMEIPQKVREKYPWLVQPIDQTTRERLKGLVDGAFQDQTACEVETEIREGAELYEVLKTAQEGDYDLIATNTAWTDSSMPSRLARKAPCSLLIIPPKPKIDYRRILVPVDFSRFSALQMEVAVAFGIAQGANCLDVFHAFKLPPRSHKVTVPMEEVEAMTRDYAISECNDLLAKTDLRGLESEVHVIKSGAPGVAVTRYVKEHLGETDLIVIGCRGKDALTAALLGSNAEEIIRDSPVPVVAVKQKGTGSGLLENILGKGKMAV